MGIPASPTPGSDGPPAPAGPGGLTFELDRFDWGADGRLEVVGRWYGLRGHRFMRPVLSVVAGDDRRRLLAVLEHKPWAAVEGEDWLAVFPWAGEPLDFDDAELAVAPSVAVELTPPRGPGGRRRAPAPDPKRTGRAATRRPDERTVARLERELAGAQADREQLRAEVALLEGRLAAERDAAERREQHRAAREERAAAEERDEAVRERDRARDERDEARRAATEARELLIAHEARETPAHQAGEDRAQVTARALEREREQARRAREKAEGERKRAEVLAEKAAGAHARAERAEADARAERLAARADRDAARAQTSAAALPATPRGARSATPLPDVPPSAPGQPAWLARTLAVVGLVILALVLLLVIKGSL